MQAVISLVFLYTGAFSWIQLQAANPATGAMRAKLEPMQLISEASPIVQGVIALLVLMSVGCWFIMGAKWVRLREVRGKTDKFLRGFWQRDGQTGWGPRHLENLYAESHAYGGSPVASVFRAGYAELARLTNQTPASPGALASPAMQGAASGNQQEQQAGQCSPDDIDNVERALRRATSSEMTRLESALPFLATTASTAPFIGLFGTVWGIMNTFLAIYGQQDTGLDVVLPGIAEALIATAIGLAAAIPAVMAYNFFVRRLRLVEIEMDAFSSDYLNVVKRNFLRS